MKTEVEKKEDGLVELKVEVPFSDLEKDLSAAYKKIATQVKIPGFRKGHIPKAIIDQRLGQETVLNEMVQEAVPRLYRDALKETDVKPVGFPDIEVDSVKSGEPLVFKAKVPVKPIPVVGQYKGLEAEIPERTVTESDITERLAVLQERFSELSPKNSGGEKGDFILCDYTVAVKGDKIDELAVSDYMIKLGAEDVAKELTEAASLAPAGTTRSFKMTMPETHPNKKIAGREVEIELTVKEVKEEIRPALSDEFAKQVSEFDTIGDLREDIRTKLEKRRDDEIDAELKRQVARAAVRNATLKVPEAMIKEEVENMIHRFEEPMRREGKNVDEYFKAAGLSRDMLESQFSESAKARVEQDLVLEAIADAEGITVSDEEIDEEIKKAAEVENTDAERLRKELERLERMDDLEVNLKMRKALELIVAEAKPVEVSAEEYARREAEAAGQSAEAAGKSAKAAGKTE